MASRGTNPPDRPLLCLPASIGARITILAALERCERRLAAWRRRASAGELHALRIALRKLRAALRAHESLLGARMRKRRRRIGKLARLTNAVREADVRVAWLRAARVHMPSQPLDELEARLQRERGKALEKAIRRLRKKLPRQLKRTRNSVEVLRIAADGGALVREPSFGVALADSVRSQQAFLAPAMAQPSSTEQRHRIRLRAKRLRYTLESVGRCAETRAAIDLLTGVQDMLGACRDRADIVALFDAELFTADDRAAVEIRRLRERASGEARRMLTRFEGEWLHAEALQRLGAVTDAAAALETLATPASALPRYARHG